MSETKLKWVAHFKNQHVLNQFDSKGKERLFREVLDRQDELEKFELAKDGKIYSVNLRTGKFCVRGIEFDLFNLSLQNAQYRIIYYKRMQVFANQTNVGKPKLLCYLLGLQTTIDGKNIQRILLIQPNGGIVLQVKN